MFKIPAIEEFERDFEGGETEVSVAERWSLPSPDRIRFPIKRPETKPILKWTLDSSYTYKPIIFHEAGTNKLSWIKNFLLNSLIDEEKLLAFRGDPEDKTFVPISKDTLERAKQFLTPYLTVFSTSAYAVEILPGPDGSVDIHWKNPKKELLVNIPADKNTPALFYGDDYGNLSIEGKMETNSLHPSVIMWLINS
jgi:hypothetical protein